MLKKSIQKKTRVLAFGPYTLFLLATFLLTLLAPPASSASSTEEYLRGIPKALTDPQKEYKNQASDLHSIIQEMAVKLFTNLEEPDPEAGILADGVTVSTFVDLKKLNKTSSFGRYIAEQLMTEFQQHGYLVKEVRKSSSIQVKQNHGEFGLSRNIKEIGKNMEARTMVTGTYALAGDHIMVNAKVLDNKDSTLLSSATMLLPKTRLADLLLSDGSTASSANQKGNVIYMKRMEL